ncbi:MAG: response regulator [Candidatus Omnitrophica bacterium]|nr:response regulator [Candidatus Omnitrophota bacterium]
MDTDVRAGSRRLLIVDDEAKVCQSLALYFVTKGYEVRTVARGEEALALADVFRPDVVLLDLLMPGMNGIELLKIFKQQAQAPKIIMLSAADDEQVVSGALQLGADAYMCKPANLAQLEHLVSGFWPS